MGGGYRLSGPSDLNAHTTPKGRLIVVFPCSHLDPAWLAGHGRHRVQCAGTRTHRVFTVIRGLEDKHYGYRFVL